MKEKTSPPRRFFGSAWLLAAGAAFLLAALWLWSEKLYPGPVGDVSTKPPAIGPEADGGPEAGEPQPLAFQDEYCRSWNVSAVAPVPKNLPLVFIASRLSDPHGLVLAGFASECGPPARVLEVEKAQAGELERLVAESHAAALAVVGLAAARLAEREAPRLPLLFADIPNPSAAGFDRPGAAGISPWVPPEPMLRHWLDVLPSRARLALFHPSGRLDKLTRAITSSLKLRRREPQVYPQARGVGLEPFLSRAARESDAWLVLCDRSSDSEEFFERLVTQAEKLKIPVAVSDEEHVRRGALVGVGTDSHRIGRQLCRLAGALTGSLLPPGSRVFCPEYSFAVVHLARAEKLEYFIDPAKTLQIKVYQWH